MKTSSPSPAVLIYDGECGFCRECVNYAQSITANEKIRFSAYQRLPLSEYNLSIHACSESVFLFREEKQQQTLFRGAEAIGVLLRDYGKNIMIRFIGKYILLPLLLPLHEHMYFFVARRRSHIPIRGKKCSL